MTLEKILPSPEPNIWYEAIIDLCQMIRESEPDFFGDEFHLAGRPETGIEVNDINIFSVSRGE